MKKLWKYLATIQSTGVHADMSYLDIRKTKMLNQVVLVCIPLTLFFSVANFIEERPILALINFANFLTSSSVLLFHAYNRYITARFVLLCFNSLFFGLGAYFFHNGAEYFLFSSLILAMLIFENRWIQIISSTVLIGAILVILFLPIQVPAEQLVPPGRLIFNVIGSFAFIAFTLVVFKNIQSSYQHIIEEQSKKLQDVNSNMEKLFSIIAHDLRSPISSTQTLLTLFQQDIISEKATLESLRMINNRLGQLDETLDNLLRWSIRNRVGIQTKAERVRLEPLIDSVYLFLEPQALAKGILLQKDIDATTVIVVDTEQLIVILRNIISNAIKFSFHGGTVITRTIIEAAAVKIEIQDSGTGIPPHKLEQLLHSMQTPSFGTEGERGSGLGLLLCQELLRKNEGDLAIQSSPDKGSTFILSFPKYEENTSV